MTKVFCALAVVAVAGLAAPRIASADDAAVAKTWKAKCGTCHAEDGTGKTTQGAKMKVGDMSSAAWQKDMTDDKIKEAISNGIDRTKDGVKQEMKAYKDKLKPEDIDGLVKLIRSFKK